MSRHTERSNRAHLAVVEPSARAAYRRFIAKPTQRHLQALRRQLGHAAVVGGVEYVERFAYSDAVMAVFMKLDAPTRKEAMAMIARVAEKTKVSPPPVKPPSCDERVKVRWTDEMIARFKIEAPRSKNDFDLCARLGLPPYCRHAVRRARARFGFLRASATKKPAAKGPSPAFAMPLAA